MILVDVLNGGAVLDISAEHGFNHSTMSLANLRCLLHSTFPMDDAYTWCYSRLPKDASARSDAIARFTSQVLSDRQGATAEYVDLSRVQYCLRSWKLSNAVFAGNDDDAMFSWSDVYTILDKALDDSGGHIATAVTLSHPYTRNSETQAVFPVDPLDADSGIHEQWDVSQTTTSVAPDYMPTLSSYRPLDGKLYVVRFPQHDYNHRNMIDKQLYTVYMPENVRMYHERTRKSFSRGKVSQGAL